MKKILFMHSGSGNHGCEALVRTTARLLGGPEDAILWSGHKAEDIRYGSARSVEKIVEDQEIKRFSVAYFEAQLRRRGLRQQNAIKKVFLKHLFRNATAVSIGGDNYCYPWSAEEACALDREIRKTCAHTVLWGCSVDSDALTDEIREDLAAFDLITARESITYDLLKRINPNTVQVADPAFLLESEEAMLPEGFQKGNTLGINVSPLVLQYGDHSMILRNYEMLLETVLRCTDLHICLIPHVVWQGNDDREILNWLYKTFQKTGRVSMAQDQNCCQLKYIISQCRFFVGARTHATIAAYSSCVPTLVTGYSVKARGIARDIFGTEDKYVLSVQSIEKETELTDAFMWLMEREKTIRSILETKMPEYKQKAQIGVKAFEAMLRCGKETM